MPTTTENTPTEFDRLYGELRGEVDWILEKASMSGSCGSCLHCRTLEYWECNCAQWYDYERFKGNIDDDVALEEWHESQCTCDRDREQYAEDNECLVKREGAYQAFKVIAERDDIKLSNAWSTWMSTIYCADLHDGPSLGSHYRHEARKDLFNIPIPE